MNQNAASTVFVVDDDDSVLRSLKRLLACEGYAVETFNDPVRFLEQAPRDRAGCVVLDLRMPGMNGLAVQEELARRGCHLPVVFITGHGDIPATVKAMKGGAVDFLPKPFEEDQLISAVSRALERDRAERERQSERDGLRARYDALTPREQEVARLVARGMLNKQIAAELGAAEKTIAQHRGRVMEKLGVESVPDLVRLLDRIAER